MKKNNLTLKLLFPFLVAFVFSACEKNNTSPVSPRNALSVKNLLGVWDMSLPETTPDGIFVCNGTLIRTYENLEWAYLEFKEHDVFATGKLKPVGWDRGSTCSGSKSYSINDAEHLLIIENGQSGIFKYTLSDNGTKLVYTILERGQVSDYPNGAFETYYKRTLNFYARVRQLKQPKSGDCWATALTILYSWKYNDNAISIQDVLKKYGEKYLSLFRNNSGITAAEEKELYKVVNLSVIQGLNPTIQHWYELLSKHGPLSITVDAAPPNGTIHALVINGLRGDGKPATTYITYVDPWDGKENTLPFTEFIKLYEGAAKWPLQIIYWP